MRGEGEIFRGGHDGGRTAAGEDHLTAALCGGNDDACSRTSGRGTRALVGHAAAAVARFGKEQRLEFEHEGDLVVDLGRGTRGGVGVGPAARPWRLRPCRS